jgi:hypothetical protein
LDAWKDVQKVQRAAFPLNRTNDFNKDVTSQYFPHVMPLYYQGAASNSRLLNDPADHNQNLDFSSQRTYIKLFYTTKEQFDSVLPIEVNNSALLLGPVYVKQIVLPSNNLE